MYVIDCLADMVHCFRLPGLCDFVVSMVVSNCIVCQMIAKGIVSADVIQQQKLEDRLQEVESAITGRNEDFESNVRLARLYPFRIWNGNMVCKRHC